MVYRMIKHCSLLCIRLFLVFRELIELLHLIKIVLSLSLKMFLFVFISSSIMLELLIFLNYNLQQFLNDFHLIIFFY